MEESNLEDKKKDFLVYLRISTIEKADQIVKDQRIPGIRNRSALIEYALNQIIKTVGKGGKEACANTSVAS